MKEITLEDCYELKRKFVDYTDRAEQHEFPFLAMLDFRMTRSLKQFEDLGEINQEDANAMFRVILKMLGEDYSEYAKEPEVTEDV